MSYLVRKWEVLMWKNLIVRKRQWFLTLFEIVIPILLFWALAWMRQNDVIGQKAKDKPQQIYPEYSEYEINEHSFIFHDFVKLAYAPDTPFTQDVIKEFNKTFTAQLQQKKPVTFNAFATELEMEEFFHQQYENQSVHLSNSVGCGIVFENIGNDSLVPKDFKYKIRSSKPGWNTKDLFPQFLPAGPTDEGDSYFNEGFLAIQLAIDNAYIQLATGRSQASSYNISMQKFPFPEYKEDMFNVLFKSLMPLITVFSFITISISVLKKVVEEKTSGVNELMKMMGLKTWMVWAGWVLNGLLVYIITCVVITFLLCHSFDEEKGPVIAYVHFTIVFIQFLLFCLGSIFFCFAISAFFMRPTIAMVAGMTLWMVTYATLNQYIGTATVPFGLKLLLCLVPIYNMCTGYIVIAAFESRGISINWLNLFSSATGGNEMSLGIVFVMFFAQMAFYMFVTWYVTSIHPGPYGRAQPWYFLFKLPSVKDKRKDAILHNDEDDSSQRYETPPGDLNTGLRIQELRKVFNNGVVAVDRVNLDIYEGEITALLGHNGAGKTTTMSILTGMYSPSSGAVYAKDYNIFENMDRFRNSLGLCPQHDLLFPYLTAIEHLIFFGMLKGMNMNVARSEGIKLLQMLHVSEKKSVLSDKLSGGMKRKLSLAIALIGKPKVLVLDEPTSGMDPESRREMWDLLLSLRGERTILITTHFMEEADVLGDRIAIMDHGKVKCYGTTLFLKRIYGTGYHLTMMKKADFPLQPITDRIKTSVAGADVKSVHTTQVTYSIPQEAAAKMPGLFSTIEREKEDLGVTGVGISCTTMEEVFLKVGELAREEKYEFDKNGSQLNHPNSLRNTSNEALTYRKRQGLPLLIQQFTSLLHKRSLFTIRRPIASIIFFVVPLLLTWFTIKNGLVDVLKGLKEPPLTMSLSEYGKTEAFVAGPAVITDLYQRVITQQGSKGTPVPTNLLQYLIGLGRANVVQYKTLDIVATNFYTHNQSVVALYNGIAYHAAPISVNVLSNVLLRNQTQTSGNTITTVNHPLDLDGFLGACSALNEVSLWMGALMWLILIPMGVKGFLVDFILFPHNERTSSAKQLQLMTGVPPPLYWAACFTWDYFIYLVSCSAMFIIILMFDTNALFTEARDYGVLLLILVLYGVSGICCTYLYSFVGKSSNMAGTLFTFVTLITGSIAPPIMHFLLRLSDSTGMVVRTGVVMPIHYLLCLEPQYAFGSAVMNYALLLSEHSGCKQCDNTKFKDAQGVCSASSLMASLSTQGNSTNQNVTREAIAEALKSCSRSQKHSLLVYGKCQSDKSYLEFATEANPNGLLQFVLFLSVDWILCLLVISLIEYGYLSHAVRWLKVQWVGKKIDEEQNEDADVTDEKDRVDAARHHRVSNATTLSAKSPEYVEVKELKIGKKQFQDDSFVLTVDKLAKKFSRSFTAVKGISFSVSAGECFGLLGVNGAGKTTTFRMLTGDETPTTGEARILDYDIVKNRSKYLTQIGYCPQFDGINEFLTGEEMLKLFANLRGIPPSQVQPQINEWISLLGLEEYRRRRCGKYSGGNKRKLSTAMALIGDPPVVFLDEPTTGVDPVARRNLWDVLMRCQKSGQAIVLTSHSMEECEALCTRLTIMVHGRMKCIGSNQYLRQRYGQGYTIMIKLHTHPNQDNLLAHLKEDMAKSFSAECTLKDEHKSLLHYHIRDKSILLSELFSVMERLKMTHSLMEDYTVGDTTLEQVFIAFARQSNS